MSTFVAIVVFIAAASCGAGSGVIKLTEYSATGTHIKSAVITWVDQNNQTHLSTETLPWRKTLRLKKGDRAVLIVAGFGRGRARCQIKLGGATIAVNQTADVNHPTAQCATTLEE